MSKNKIVSKNYPISPEKYKLYLPQIFLLNEICIRNNINKAKELGLEVKIEVVNNEVKFTLNDPLKPRRKRFYELRDDNRYKQILNRLNSLYR